MGTKRTQLLLKGSTGKSCLVEKDAENRVLKQKEIGEYKAFLLSDKEYKIIASDTADKMLVEYAGDYVNGIYRVIIEDNKPIFKAYVGVFCIIWYDKKNFDKLHLLWTELGEERYQYFEFKSRGIDYATIEEIGNNTFSTFVRKLPKELSEKVDFNLLCNEIKSIGSAGLIMEG